LLENRARHRKGKGMSTDIDIQVVPPDRWATCIRDVISVRASAYEQWNGPKTEETQAREADAWLRKWGQRRNPSLFVAKQQDETVGYLSADERESGEHYISHIGVSGKLKRRGIGRALVQQSEEKARDYGCRALTTTTYNRFKGMLILLLQEGFYIQGTTWIEGATEPRICLRKDLK